MLAFYSHNADRIHFLSSSFKHHIIIVRSINMRFLNITYDWWDICVVINTRGNADSRHRDEKRLRFRNSVKRKMIFK